MTDRLLTVALSILGGALLLCLGGIIWLASANPARAIPDILVGTTTLVVGAIVGILVPHPTVVTRRNQRGAGELGLVVVVLLVVILVVVLFRVL